MICKLFSMLLTVCLSVQAVCFASSYKIDMTMIEPSQAFLVTEQVTYTNETGAPVSDIMFSAYANSLRRESTLPFDNEALEKCWPYGFAPSGIDMANVLVNGEKAQWAVQGDGEYFIRVVCPLAPGESATVTFAYTLLLSENLGFLGWGDEDVRLSMFYPAVCAYEDGFITNPVSRASEWFYSEDSSFTVNLSLPYGWDVACAGDVTYSGGVYSIQLDGSRELALALSRRFHSVTDGTVVLYGQDRIKLNSLKSTARKYIGAYENIIGPLPCGKLTVVLSEAGVSRTAPGFILLSKNETELLPYMIARQYFMACDPAIDPFLTSATAEYLSLMALEDMKGEAAFRKALDSDILPALSITIPGGLTPDSPLTRFVSRSDYDAVVRLRGAAVLHEMRISAGTDKFKSALSAFSANGKTVQDFVSCLNEAMGREMGEALIAWLYTINEYSGANIYSYD